MARGEQIPRSAWPTRRKEWERRLVEWAASGQSQSRYCRERGLNANTLSGWKRRLGWQRNVGTGAEGKRQVAPSAARPSVSHKPKTACRQAAFFVPLRVTGTAAAATSMRLEVVLRNGRVVRCESGVAPSVLAAVAAALETDGAPC